MCLDCKKNNIRKNSNKSSGKKILNTTFYPDQKGITSLLKANPDQKGINKLKRKILNQKKMSTFWL